MKSAAGLEIDTSYMLSSLLLSSSLYGCKFVCNSVVQVELCVHCALGILLLLL